VSKNGSSDYVFGQHASFAAIKKGQGNKIFVDENAKGENVNELKKLAREAKVPIKWVPKVRLDQLSMGGTHQGVVVAVSDYVYLDLAELLKNTAKAEPFFLILDSLEDPHNFGSILRTADAAGVDGVIIPKHRAVGITSVVASVSTGALQYVPIARVTNLSETVKKLKQEDFWIFGTDLEGTDYRKWNTQGKLALIVGNEGRGVSYGLKKQVDEILTIPMQGHVQSLNVGVATGLLIYEVFRSRNN